jgi:hypothetical protein
VYFIIFVFVFVGAASCDGGAAAAVLCFLCVRVCFARVLVDAWNLRAASCDYVFQLIPVTFAKKS